MAMLAKGHFSFEEDVYKSPINYGDTWGGGVVILVLLFGMYLLGTVVRGCV